MFESTALAEDVVKELLGEPQNEKSAKVEFSHAPIKPEELPLVGKLFPASIAIKGTKELGAKVKALTIRDGRLMEVAPLRSYMGDHGEAVFDFEFYSPLAEISYQFLFTNAAGESAVSKRYSIRRKCIAEIAFAETPPENAAGNSQEEHMLLMLKRAKALERDLAIYEQSLQLLHDLKERLK
ncbi:MAG: hypothetical protein K1X83_13055 [Oligoflexia bacterium]|nr:hypothetical protein [Oligoflexia bacterium]